MAMFVPMQFAVEDIVGAYGMINYVDARTAWMDDIVKKAQADDISQARLHSSHTFKYPPLLHKAYHFLLKESVDTSSQCMWG